MSDPSQPKQPSNWGPNDWVVVAMAIGALGLFFWGLSGVEFRDVRASSQNKAVLSNLRQLQAGADQYFAEHHGVSSVASATIVGTAPSAMIPSTIWRTVAQETYTPVIVQGQGISAAGVAGARTVTFGP